MKQYIVLIFILVSTFNVVGQSTRKKSIKYLLDNSSTRHMVALIVKNASNENCFVWSEYLIDYYTIIYNSKDRAKQKILSKILKNDTFGIIPSHDLPLGLVSQTNLNQHLINLKNKSIKEIIKYFYKGYSLDAKYANFFKEVAYLLWRNDCFVFNGENSESNVDIVIVNNKVVNDIWNKENKENEVNESVVNKNIDTVLFFPKYNFVIKFNNIDTQFHPINIMKYYTDIVRLSAETYNGSFEFIKVFSNQKQRKVELRLYNKDYKLEKKEFYEYTMNVQNHSDTFYYNLPSRTEIINSLAIVPFETLVPSKVSERRLR